MRQGSTLFLKSVIFLIGASVFAICVLVLPKAILAELSGDFDYGPIMIGLYMTAIPFFFALYQGLLLLGYIDANTAFSPLSVKALQNIKYCAFSISSIFAAGMPYIFYVGDRDDAPGVVALGLVISASACVIGVFAAVLERLLQNAIDIKSENDLTV